MGVIKKEGLKQSIVTYVGVLLGAINTLYFYPKYFTEQELGLFQFIIQTSTLLFPFISLGVHNLSVRMFPVFKNEKNGHNGLLFFLLLGMFCGFFIFLGVAYFSTGYVDDLLMDRSLLIRENWVYIIPLAGLVILSMIFSQYVLNFKKVLVPSIVNDLYIKIGLPVIAILLFFDVITLVQGIYILLGVFVVNVLTLFVYIIYIKQWHLKPNWSFLTKPVVDEMKSYSFYGILGSLGGILATRIDILMIALLATNDVKDVGVYSISFFIAHVITVPARSISNIASPVIADAWKNNDVENVKSVYSKSSIVLLTPGIFFLIGIWSSVDDLFKLMPNGENYAGGKYVILILGLAKLFNMATGINDQVISYSKYYRFNFYATLILAVLNVISNYIFIPIYEINGAALATASSMLIYNISKTAFAYFKMGMQPFSLKTIYIILIAVVVYFIGSFIPPTEIVLLDIIIRSTVIAILFISSTIYFNISSDINALFWQSLDKVKSVFK